MGDPSVDDILKPLNRDVEHFQIADYKVMREAALGHRRVVFNDGKRSYDRGSGEVRFDNAVTSERRTFAATSLSGAFDKAKIIKAAQASVEAERPPPEEYSASVYFKKGFVHEVDVDRPDGGATLSAALNTIFDAPEDGQDFAQANIDKMVKMAMETEGFEIALDFNTDEDGGDVVYTGAYLDANDGKIRNALEAELEGSGISFEGRSANDVLSDYRGYVVEQAVAHSVKNQFSATLSGHELDEAVEHFMEHKFDKNADKISYSDQNATLEGHNQSERAVNLMFREIEGDHGLDGHLEHKNLAGQYHHDINNHTHIVRGKDNAMTGGTLSIRSGDQADEAVFATIESNSKRLASLSQYSDEEARHNAYEIRAVGNVKNSSIDNLKVVFNVDGEVTSEYNAALDQIDVRVDGHIYAKVVWPDAKELIDPARVKIGSIDDNGVGVVHVADNIDPILSAERRAAAGITPMTDAIEEAVRITTDCKNLSLLSKGDLETYKELLQKHDIEGRLDNLAVHYKAYTGVDMSNHVDGLKAQYLNAAYGEDSLQAIRDDDQIAVEIALTYPELGVNVYGKESAVNQVSALYDEQKFDQYIGAVLDDPKDLVHEGKDAVALTGGVPPELTN